MTNTGIVNKAEMEEKEMSGLNGKTLTGALRSGKQDETEIIPKEEEKKIFEETWRQLKTDAFVAFAFKRCKDGVWLSRYILGEFNENYLIYSIEEALKFYREVEKGGKEPKNAVFERVKKDILTNEEGNDSLKLFEIPLQDFADAIVCMGADELQGHMLYARGIIENLQGQLEELSYRLAEYEKHGSGIRP